MFDYVVDCDNPAIFGMTLAFYLLDEFLNNKVFYLGAQGSRGQYNRFFDVLHEKIHGIIYGITI
jgi:hypothetical protein